MADIYKAQDNLNEALRLYKEILKRSIYEYLIVVKYDKNVNSYGLTHEEINDKIKYIEEKWVSNV